VDIFWNGQKLIEFSPIFIRTSFLLFSVPMFSSQIIFPIMRGGIALAVSLAIYSGLKPTFSFFEMSLADIIAGILSELFFSFLVFIIIRIFLLSPQLSGETISYQLGYGLMTLVSPFEENPVSVITEFIFLIAITLFFVLDIHIGFLWGIKKSFEIVPPFSFALSENQSEFLLQRLRESFYVSLQIAFPVILAMFIIEISIAIISRTIPQFNIFVVGFPLRIAIGILILTFTFDRIGFLIGEFMKKFIESFSDIILLGVKH